MSLHFSQVLRAGHVDLHCPADSPAAAVEHLLGLLRGDPRILCAEHFAQAVRARGTPVICSGPSSFCLAHARTEAIQDLVMAAARLSHPLPSPENPPKALIRLVFVAGIPAALNTEYLRLVGAMARICSQPEATNRLLTVKEPTRFVEILESALNPL